MSRSILARLECCEIHKAIAFADSTAIERLLKKRWWPLRLPPDLLRHGSHEDNTVLLCLLGGCPNWGAACPPFGFIPLFPLWMLTRLLDLGADPNQKNASQRNSFHEAAGYCCYRRRVGRFGNPPEYSRRWRSFIFKDQAKKYGGEAGLPAILEILVHAGAEINHVDRKGQNALHYACRKHSDPAAIKCLLELGVIPSVKDHQGKLPRDFANAEAVKIFDSDLAGKQIGFPR